MLVEVTLDVSRGYSRLVTRVASRSIDVLEVAIRCY